MATDFVSRSDELRLGDGERLAQVLGWFSIGLGIAEVIAPRSLGSAIGAGHRPGITRLCGVREIVSGVGLLSRRAPAAWAWSRVAGDAMDLALLATATKSRNSNPARLAVAATAVLGVTATDIYAAQGLSGSATVESVDVEVRASITINSTPQTLYSFWRNPENLPRFMHHLESVTATGERSSHWVAKAPAGQTVEWDSQITDEHPNQRIAWRTVEHSQIAHEGSVSFEPGANRAGTIVRVSMLYRPPAGKLGVGVARFFGEEPQQQIRDDLRRLKQLLETGEIATTRGQSSGKRSLLSHLTLGGRMQ